VIFTIQDQGLEWETARIAARSLSTGAQKVLVEGAADARHLPSGHLVFMRRGVLMAAPFDVTRLEVTGGAVAAIDSVMHAIGNGSTSRAGSGGLLPLTAPWVPVTRPGSRTERVRERY
jgi:serine/threonine-protein kinase